MVVYIYRFVTNETADRAVNETRELLEFKPEWEARSSDVPSWHLATP